MGFFAWLLVSVFVCAACLAAGYGLLLTTYIVGRDEAGTIAVFRRLLKKGYGIISDQLGEYVTDDTGADRLAAAHLANVRHLADLAAAYPGRVAVAMKPTALGLTVGSERARLRAAEICSVAASLGVFVWFDVESKETLAAYHTFVVDLAQVFPNVGVVVQAMHLSSTKVVTMLASHNVHVRLVKGAYADGEILETQALRDSLIKLNAHARVEFWDDRLVALGSCDDVVVASAGIAQEHQLLWGVRSALAVHLREQGKRVTIYCPFGSLKSGHGYFMRRLKEGIHFSMMLNFVRNILEARRFRKSITRD